MVNNFDTGKSHRSWTRFGPAPSNIERAKRKITDHHPAFAAIIEGDEGQHGDLPRWPRAKTLDDMEAIAAGIIKRLRRFRGQFPGADALSDYLGSCTPGSRCFSGACVVCGWILQNWAATQVGRFVQDRRDVPKPQRTTTIAVSIVPSNGFVRDGQLHTLNIGRVINRAVAKIEKTSLAIWGLFGLDVSLNDYTQKGMVSGFQVQLYGYVETTDGPKLCRLLKEAFPTSEVVGRPIRSRRYDGTVKAASYAFKPLFVRRVSYLDKDGRWNTRKISLRAIEHVELMLALHRLGLHRRIEMFNLRPYRFGKSVGLDWVLE